jgi:hypothetical protein
MSVRPAVNVSLRSTPPTRTVPSDTSVWFVAGITEAGPTTPVLIRSMSDFGRVFGSRVTYSILYDALDHYFREGGSRAYVQRVVGPTPVLATRNLLDAGAAISLAVSSIGPGTFYNSIKVGVRAGGAGGTFVLFVQDANNVEVETSPDLANQAAAVLWAQGSQYIRVALGVSSNNPAVVAAAALASGTDDHANITDTQWNNALLLLTPDLGVGQISAPGRTSDVGHQQVLAVAATTYRTALLDAPDTPTQATLLSSAAAARIGNQRFGGMFWPFQTVPGIVAGTTRSVPPCAVVAGEIARNDGAGLGPDAPAAGDNGIARYTIGLSQPALTDAQRDTLNDAGVNVIRSYLGGFRTYGWRSLVDGLVDPDWRDLGHARLYMAIAGDGGAIAESFMFKKIDGQGKLIAEFNGALSGMLKRYWDNGDLYGETATDAFFVDTGDQVNTETTINDGQLHAVLNVRMSPFAEYVAIEIYKHPITEGVN